MQEMGIETSILDQILSGAKTVEARLRTGKFVTVRKGDKVSLREDTWQNDKIVKSVPQQAVIVLTETRYFDSFSDLFAEIDYTTVLPKAVSSDAAIVEYRRFYTPDQEREHGVVAISFKLSR